MMLSNSYLVRRLNITWNITLIIIESFSYYLLAISDCLSAAAKIRIEIFISTPIKNCDSISALKVV